MIEMDLAAPVTTQCGLHCQKQTSRANFNRIQILLYSTIKSFSTSTLANSGQRLKRSFLFQKQIFQNANYLPLINRLISNHLQDISPPSCFAHKTHRKVKSRREVSITTASRKKYCRLKAEDQCQLAQIKLLQIFSIFRYKKNS